MIKLEFAFALFAGFKFFEEGFDSLIITFGRVNCLQDVFVAVNEGLILHFRDEVNRAVGVVAGEAI